MVKWESPKCGDDTTFLHKIKPEQFDDLVKKITKGAEALHKINERIIRVEKLCARGERKCRLHLGTTASMNVGMRRKFRRIAKKMDQAIHGIDKWNHESPEKINDILGQVEQLDVRQRAKEIPRYLFPLLIPIVFCLCEVGSFSGFVGIIVASFKEAEAWSSVLQIHCGIILITCTLILFLMIVLLLHAIPNPINKMINHIAQKIFPRKISLLLPELDSDDEEDDNMNMSAENSSELGDKADMRTSMTESRGMEAQRRTISARRRTKRKSTWGPGDSSKQGSQSLENQRRVTAAAKRRASRATSNVGSSLSRSTTIWEDEEGNFDDHKEESDQSSEEEAEEFQAHPIRFLKSLFMSDSYDELGALEENKEKGEVDEKPKAEPIPDLEALRNFYDYDKESDDSNEDTGAKASADDSRSKITPDMGESQASSSSNYGGEANIPRASSPSKNHDTHAEQQALNMSGVTTAGVPHSSSSSSSINYLPQDGTQSTEPGARDTFCDGDIGPIISSSLRRVSAVYLEDVTVVEYTGETDQYFDHTPTHDILNNTFANGGPSLNEDSNITDSRTTEVSSLIIGAGTRRSSQPDASMDNDDFIEMSSGGRRSIVAVRRSNRSNSSGEGGNPIISSRDIGGGDCLPTGTDKATNNGNTAAAPKNIANERNLGNDSQDFNLVNWEICYDAATNAMVPMRRDARCKTAPLGGRNGKSAKKTSLLTSPGAKCGTNAVEGLDELLQSINTGGVKEKEKDSDGGDKKKMVSFASTAMKKLKPTNIIAKRRTKARASTVAGSTVTPSMLKRSA